MCQTYGCDNRSDGTGEEHGYCDPCATARRSERTLRAEIARLRETLADIASGPSEHACDSARAALSR